MPDLITRAKSVPVPIAKFHYRNPPSPQLQHKSPFGQRSKSSGSSGCLRTVTCWHLSNLVLYLDAASNGLNDAWELRDDAVPCAAEDMTAWAEIDSSTTARYMRRVAVEASSLSSVRRL